MNDRGERSRAPFRRGIRRLLPVAAFLAALAAGVQPPAAAGDEAKLESGLQRLSYMLGFRIGSGLHGQGMREIDAAALAAAIDDVLNQRPPRLTEEEMRAAEAEYRAGFAAVQAREAESNLEAGRAFLASNAGNEGVVEMPDGLQYRILRAGDGPKPSADDRVVVHYRGRRLDGSEFDSSYRRGEPAEFMVGGVIQGWQAALKAMPKGSHWEVWIPAALAYGERGAGGAIGPNQALHFEIELIEVTPAG